MDITEFRSPGLLDGIEREDTESQLDWTKAQLLPVLTQKEEFGFLEFEHWDATDMLRKAFNLSAE